MDKKPTKEERMTRDYLAGQALNALVRTGYSDKGFLLTKAGKLAYEIADTAMEARG